MAKLLWYPIWVWWRKIRYSHGFTGHVVNENMKLRKENARLKQLLEQLNSRKITSLYTHDEFKKVMDALEEAGKISPCDELPYYPKSIEVELTGKVKP